MGMFVRVKSTPNSPPRSVQLVKSVRQGDKVKQKIVRYVGSAMDDDALLRLKELAHVIKAKLEANHQTSFFTLLSRVPITSWLPRLRSHRHQRP